jgi:hypothetical protein
LGARYAELTGANQLYVNALNAQRRDIIRALASTNPDIGPTITEVVDKAYVDMAEHDWSNLFTIATIYARLPDGRPSGQIVDFFQSDVGQRLLANAACRPDQAVRRPQSPGAIRSASRFLDRVRTLLAERGIEM